MLAVVDHRGDRSEVVTAGPATFGRRSWSGRPNAGPSDPAGVASIGRDDAGALVAMVGRTIPALGAGQLAARFAAGAPLSDLADLDGAFALAHWDPSTATLTLARDAFGQRSLYWTQSGDTFWFATELKQLLAIAELPVALDPIAVHKYLTFSFVPGEATPIQGVRRVLPGHVLVFRGGAVTTRPWFELSERIAPIEPGAAAKRLRQLGRAAVERRLVPGARVGLYLSGGLDSSAVGWWLKEAGADLTAFTLDFGAASVEREEAAQAARHLGIPLELVTVDPSAFGANLGDILWKLDLPFGDAVTAPHRLLGRAARAGGLT